MSEQAPEAAFRVARKGYDRNEVDAHLAELHARIGALENERNQLAAQLTAVGVESPAEVRSELEAVAADVARVLDAAREAADAMRARAAEDAARWRHAAQEEADDARRRAEHDAVALREEAWRTGTELLEQVTQQAERIKEAAQQDGILTRAGAEQEAHRLVASARRDIADETRLARLQAERMTEEARVAGEQLAADAHRKVELAQERVRALEQRHGELTREVEAAQDALGLLQAEIEEQQRPPEPEPELASEQASPAVTRPDWTAGLADDEVTVRVLPPAGVAAGEPVDAEAMAAEVRALRSASGPSGDGAPEEGEEPAPVAPAPVAAEAGPDQAEPAAEPEPAPALEAPPPEPAAEPAPEPEPELELETSEPEPVPGPEPVPVAVVDEAMPEPVPVAAVEEEAEPEPVAEVRVGEPPEPELEVPGGEKIDDLFARLRGGGGGAAPAVVVEPEPEPVPAPPPTVEPQPDRPPLRAVPAASGPDPFELRDRLLLPLTNRALREAKRAIVDMQNLVLEELRTSGGTGTPDLAVFSAGWRPVLAELATGSRRAGALAAAEFTGAAQPPDIGDPAADPGAELSAAMRDGLADVLQRSAAAGGPRQQSAQVSRFFRAWRTDEAERRVRAAAFAAFHGGLLDACAALGVAAVEGRANGRTCAACPASTGQPWAPDDSPPDGAAVPPAHDDCECTLVPRP